MRILLILSAVLFSLHSQAYYIFGDPVKVGDGKVKAFADVDKYGRLKKIGMAMTEGALQNLPHHPEEYVFKFPSVLNIPPYDHLAINWMPHGHEPDGIYNLPHFDFHFYFISEEKRAAITCTGADRDICLAMPTENTVPPFYVPGPEGVPQMGWHWVDIRSPEYNGQIFTATYIYGYYAGEMIFIEPMITRDFLLSKTHLAKEVPLPAVLPTKGYFPTSYEVSYDCARKMHMITLKAFGPGSIEH